MLRVLLILLCVLLGVVVLLGVLLLALLCMRAGVELVGVSGEVTLDAIYGPLRIPLWPTDNSDKSDNANNSSSDNSDLRSRTMTDKYYGRASELYS